MYRIFDRAFREKLGPIEQNNRKFFVKNAIKHQLLGSDRTTHSTKTFGGPPKNISVTNAQVFEYFFVSNPVLTLCIQISTYCMFIYKYLKIMFFGCYYYVIQNSLFLYHISEFSSKPY